MAAAAMTITPPTDLALLSDVGHFLARNDKVALLLGPDGEQLPLPQPMYETLVAVVDALRQGQAISLVPVDTTMTTQQAADFLGISRPTFVKLLEDGRIPFERMGPRSHRRLQLLDVLAFQKEQRAKQERILAALASEDDDLYGDSAADYERALRTARRTH